MSLRAPYPASQPPHLPEQQSSYLCLCPQCDAAAQEGLFSRPSGLTSQHSSAVIMGQIPRLNSLQGRFSTRGTKGLSVPYCPTVPLSLISPHSLPVQPALTECPLCGSAQNDPSSLVVLHCAALHGAMKFRSLTTNRDPFRHTEQSLLYL